MHGLVSVDAHVELLAIKEVGNKFNYSRDTGGTADQDDLMDVDLVNIRVTEDLFNRVQSTLEEILTELFKTGP